MIDLINQNLNKKLDFYTTTDNISVIENNLKTQLKQYVKAIEQLRINEYLNSKSKKRKMVFIDYNTFTACAIGAKYFNIGAYGTSHGYLLNYGVFMPLFNKLKKIGQIGRRSNKNIIKGKRNFVGKCAEVKASYAINKKNRITNISDIEFTKAYRPRTMQTIKRCNNCVYIFGNV
ncbi:hypothetical protein [Flavobacterium johnsoniae]|uniref:hypothetical protein n=1 Tax=Flavobacterium johnsoniae TaxID=986 RepID=UPI000F505A9A|nr:hypothetical protein [Flavobacterium johnsoniae]WQG82368.1 hypothetical protein SR927_04460 [Flavobacterium johnsoniae UW101]